MTHRYADSRPRIRPALKMGIPAAPTARSSRRLRESSRPARWRNRPHTAPADPPRQGTGRITEHRPGRRHLHRRLRTTRGLTPSRPRFRSQFWAHSSTFSDVHRPLHRPLRRRSGQFRTPVQNWKACWDETLASSNLVSSAFARAPTTQGRFPGVAATRGRDLRHVRDFTVRDNPSGRLSAERPYPGAGGGGSLGSRRT